jgi:hypothetical protein
MYVLNFGETVAPSTWEAFQERVARLYEQNAPLSAVHLLLTSFSSLIHIRSLLPS